MGACRARLFPRSVAYNAADCGHASRTAVFSCLGDWYFAPEIDQSSVHDEILETMQSYQEFTPTAFVLGDAEGVCGKFN